MRKRFLLSIAMLAIGAAMLAAAGVASPGSAHKASGPASSVAKKGGTLHFSLQTDLENVDPARAYVVTEWQIEFMTQLPMLSYTHAPGNRGYRLYKAGASRYKVSNSGKTYTFTIRKGLKFSDGTKITAANYRTAFVRSLTPAVQSPAASFITDPHAVEIVGATDFNAGHGTLAGVRTKGKYTLIVRLVRPSPLLLSLIALPFFGAQPTGFPNTPITDVPFGRFKQLPSGGAYYISNRVPNRTTVIKRNKFYHGPIPHHVNQYVYEAHVDAAQAFLLTKQGKIDWSADGLDPSVYAGLHRQYGTKRGPYRVFGSSCTLYVALNNARTGFGKITTRKGVNYLINRNTLTRLLGADAGTPTSHLLSPTIPGYRKARVYPNSAQLSKARKLIGSGSKPHINVWHSTSAISTQVAALIETWFRSVGYSSIDDVTISSGYYTKIGHKGTSYDAGRAGWCQDFPDPYDYMNKLLDGTNIQPENNDNFTYTNIGALNRKLHAAAKLRPPKRYKTYGALDLATFKKYAPMAPYLILNDREFFSSRVATKSIATHAVFELDLGKMALK